MYQSISHTLTHMYEKMNRMHVLYSLFVYHNAKFILHKTMHASQTNYVNYSLKYFPFSILTPRIQFTFTITSSEFPSILIIMFKLFIFIMILFK